MQIAIPDGMAMVLAEPDRKVLQGRCTNMSMSLEMCTNRKVRFVITCTFFNESPINSFFSLTETLSRAPSSTQDVLTGVNYKVEN